MSETSFCLDLQEKEIRACDIKTTGGKLEFVTLGVKEAVPYFFGTDNKQLVEKQAENISQLWTSLKTKKKIVDIIIPDFVTYSQILMMPQLKEKELLSAIRYQSDEFIPMPIDDTNLDVEILREDPVTRKILVLIVAVAKKTVSQIEKAIEMAGLQVGYLENELSAIGRLCSEKFSKTPSSIPTLVINFGFSGSSLYLIDPVNSLIVFSRNLKTGLELFAKDVKVNLNIDEVKAFEILKTIGFSKNGSYNAEPLLLPLMKSFTDDIIKFMALSRERFNLQIGQIKIFNYDNRIALFDKKIGEMIPLAVANFDLGSILVQNPIYQSSLNNLSSFASIIGGSL